jgi:hypothetical protein
MSASVWRPQLSLYFPDFGEAELQHSEVAAPKSPSVVEPSQLNGWALFLLADGEVIRHLPFILLKNSGAGGKKKQVFLRGALIARRWLRLGQGVIPPHGRGGTLIGC